MRVPSSTAARDLVTGAVLTVGTQVELVLAAERVQGSLVWQHACFALLTLPACIRRAHPLLATLVCATGLGLQTLAGVAPVVGGFLAMLLMLVTLGYYAPVRQGVVGVCAMGAAVLVADVLADDLVVGDMVANLAIAVLAWGAGLSMRRSLDRRVGAELDRDRFAREAVAAERSRIAGDLHDSVAHALTLMTLQAGGARERVEEPTVVRALAAIEDTGREALRDMHRFLRLLGPAGESHAEAPGLRDVVDMVERVRATGVDVLLELGDDVCDVPASVSSTAYRVVQEGLTNAVKHAPATRVSVTVVRRGDDLIVEVDDDGPGSGAHPDASGSGHGLVGLRERVALYDGLLDAGRRPDRGWHVGVTLPLTARALG